MKKNIDPVHPLNPDDWRNEALDRYSSYHGLTKREYFAAHAPTEVPEWFNPEMEEKPKKMDYPFNKFGKDSNHPHRDLVAQYYNDEADKWEENPDVQPPIVPQKLKDELKKYQEDFAENAKAINEWHTKRKIQTVAQWPIYWADMVLTQMDV